MNLDRLPEICTPSEIAAVLGKTTAWWKQECRSKKINHLRLGRDYRIEKTDLIDYLKGNKCETREYTSNSEKNATHGKSSNMSAEALNGTQLALAAVRKQKRNLQKSSSNVTPLKG